MFVLPNFFLCVLFFVFAHSLSLALSISLMNMRWRLFYKAIKVHTVSVTIKVKMCLCVVYDVIGLIEKFMFDLIALNLINFNFRKIDARWKCNQFWMMKLNITARYKIDNNRWKKLHVFHVVCRLKCERNAAQSNKPIQRAECKQFSWVRMAWIAAHESMKRYRKRVLCGVQTNSTNET